MKHILGISAYYHDSAAALVVDGKVVAAVQEERFSRIKHDARFPVQSIRYCLEESGLSIDQLGAVVFYEKPFLKFERLLETYYAFAPKGFSSFVKAMPRWVKEQLLLKQQIRQALADIEKYDKNNLKLLFSEHHLSHAASAFYPSGFEEAATLTVDGVGEWSTCTLGHGKGKDLKILKELNFPHSIGLLYSAFTYFLGFRVNSGEYKLMGLSAYGNEHSGQFKKYFDIIEKKLCDVKTDGSLRLDQRYFSYATGLRMLNDQQWQKLFGIPRRLPEVEFTQDHADLALAIQRFTEMVVLRMAKEVKRLTNAKHLCLAGGVALNGVANGKIIEAGIFEKIFVQPASGDAGGALGAALAVYHQYFGGQRKTNPVRDGMEGALLGPEYSDKEIKRVLHRYQLKASHYPDTNELLTKVVEHLEKADVVGWFQGRMEYGPRALGNRSILADARNPDIQQRLNVKIKDRESFRPFAPIVLASDASRFFDLDHPSPYMNVVGKVTGKQLCDLPAGYASMSIREKLAFVKSSIPAVTHVDLSARIQTVWKENNPRLYELLSTFKERSGIGLLVNTSFNGRDEPIVCSPEDAVKCYLKTGMDVLVLGDYLITKRTS